MIEAEIPSNESERLKKLRYYDILDTSDEELFDQIAKLASYICGVPIALVSLIDENRQWFKAKVGLTISETERKFAFCSHAILEKNPFVVKDSRKDVRFADNPLVTGEPNIIFYAGYPLDIGNDLRLGTLCVIDHVPRTLTEDQSKMMEHLAKQAMHLIKMRENIKLIEQERHHAIQANAAKRDFIAAISHDIRNPLNSLMGISEMLEATNLDQEQLTYIKQFKNSGEVILKIVNDVIYLSQLESKETNLENHLFSIKKPVELLREFYQVECQKKELHFEVHIAESVKDYYIGDERKFEKIIWNLTANAVKFTTKGKIVISITSVLRNEIEELVLEVADSGPGISEKVLPNLFQKYNSFTPEDCQIAGSGLGLSIVKLATEKMSGSITVDSQLGVGTKFKVYLPLRKGTPSPSANLVKKVATVADLKSKFINTSVLISDDNSMNRLVLQSYLKGIDFQITESADGEEAFQLAKSGNYKILFLDVEIPGMSGTELALNLRKIKTRVKPILIACTGLCMPEEKDQILSSGFDYYLSKPYQKQDLLAILEQVSR